MLKQQTANSKQQTANSWLNSLLLGVFSLFVLAGCSDTGSGGGAVGYANEAYIEGVANKGIISQAQIDLYDITYAANLNLMSVNSLPSLGTAITDNEGRYSIQLEKHFTGTVLARLTVSSETHITCDIADCGAAQTGDQDDNKDGRITFGERYKPAEDFTLSTIVWVDSSSTRVNTPLTPLTTFHAVYASQHARSQNKAVGQSIINEANAFTKAAFGLNNTPASIQPINLVENTTSTTAPLRQSVINAAFLDYLGRSEVDNLTYKLISSDLASGKVEYSLLMGLLDSAIAVSETVKQQTPQLFDKASSLKTKLAGTNDAWVKLLKDEKYCPEAVDKVLQVRACSILVEYDLDDAVGKPGDEGNNDENEGDTGESGNEGDGTGDNSSGDDKEDTKDPEILSNLAQAKALMDSANELLGQVKTIEGGIHPANIIEQVGKSALQDFSVSVNDLSQVAGPFAETLSDLLWVLLSEREKVLDDGQLLEADLTAVLPDSIAKKYTTGQISRAGNQWTVADVSIQGDDGCISVNNSLSIEMPESMRVVQQVRLQTPVHSMLIKQAHLELESCGGYQPSGELSITDGRISLELKEPLQLDVGLLVEQQLNYAQLKEAMVLEALELYAGDAYIVANQGGQITSFTGELKTRFVTSQLMEKLWFMTNRADLPISSSTLFENTLLLDWMGWEQPTASLNTADTLSMNLLPIPGEVSLNGVFTNPSTKVDAGLDLTLDNVQRFDMWLPEMERIGDLGKMRDDLARYYYEPEESRYVVTYISEQGDETSYSFSLDEIERGKYALNVSYLNASGRWQPVEDFNSMLTFWHASGENVFARDVACDKPHDGELEGVGCYELVKLNELRPWDFASANGDEELIVEKQVSEYFQYRGDYGYGNYEVVSDGDFSGFTAQAKNRIYNDYYVLGKHFYSWRDELGLEVNFSGSINNWLANIINLPRDENSGTLYAALGVNTDEGYYSFAPLPHYLLAEELGALAASRIMQDFLEGNEEYKTVLQEYLDEAKLYECNHWYERSSEKCEAVYDKEVWLTQELLVSVLPYIFQPENYATKDSPKPLPLFLAMPQMASKETNQITTTAAFYVDDFKFLKDLPVTDVELTLQTVNDDIPHLELALAWPTLSSLHMNLIVDFNDQGELIQADINDGQGTILRLNSGSYLPEITITKDETVYGTVSYERGLPVIEWIDGTFTTINL